MDRQTPPTTDTNNDDSIFSSGALVLDHYVISSCLGVGTNTTVYKCHHKDFPEQDLVLKVLHPSVAADEVASARFQKEILASYELKHRNVIRPYEFIRKDNILAYTMEYAGGGDLRQKLSEKKGFLIPDVIDFASQICCGLQAVHAAGIIHRDLKPENIFFTDDDTIKIADFGIARTSGGRKLTQQGEVLGAVDFVSPEYLQSGNVDQRSDLYAAGLIIYEMVAGRTPFKGETLMDSLMKRLKSDPEPPTVYRSECPLALSDIVMKAVQRDPDQRYQNASEMLQDINLLRGEGDQADPQTQSAMCQPLTQKGSGSETICATSGPTFARLPSHSRREAVYDGEPPRGRTLMLTAAFFVIVLVLIFVLLPTGSQEPTTLPVPVPQAKQSQEIVGDTAETAQEKVQPAVKKKIKSRPEAIVEPKPKPKESTRTKVTNKTVEQPSTATLPGPEPATAAQTDLPQASDKQEPEITPASRQTADQTAPAPVFDEGSMHHLVVEGDTISAIARKYGVSTAQVMEINDVTNPRKLPVGMALKIPKK